MHLIINTFGTQLGVQNGVFVIKHADGIKTVAPSKVKSITIRKGIKVSSNALYLALDHQIDVLLVDRSGKPYGRLWSNRFGSISTIRRKQVDWSRQREGAAWVRGVISRKLDNQIAIMQGIVVDARLERESKRAVERIEALQAKITALPDVDILEIASSLRGYEGTASKYYWYIVSEALPEAYRFKERSQNPATDPFNCLLNYAYGMLYAEVEGALIKAGVDPYIGVLHRDNYNRPTLVYDLIELYRVWADYVVIDLCLQNAIKEDSFLIDNGAYWLEGYGKRILIHTMNEYLDDLVVMNKLSRTRRTHITLEAQRLARTLLNYQGKQEDEAIAEGSQQLPPQDMDRPDGTGQEQEAIGPREPGPDTGLQAEDSIPF